MLPTSDTYHRTSFVSSQPYVFYLKQKTSIDYDKVEMGSKNHEVVPTPLIVQISGLRHGGINKLIGSLAKRNLVSKVENSKCSTILYIRISRWHWPSFQMMGTAWPMADMITSPCALFQSEILSIQWETRLELARSLVCLCWIVIGREANKAYAEVYIVADSEGNEMVLKIHRSVFVLFPDRLGLNLI